MSGHLLISFVPKEITHPNSLNSGNSDRRLDYAFTKKRYFLGFGVIGRFKEQ